MASLGLAASHPVHLGTVLTRCAHFEPRMRAKWGLPKSAGDDDGCQCVLS